MNTTALKHFIRSNGYAWPGGYPMYALMADGEVIDAQSARENYKLILAATRNPRTDTQWQVEAIDIHWEGESLQCAHSGRMINSAYGVPE
jgi:hypothetical protein